MDSLTLLFSVAAIVLPIGAGIFIGLLRRRAENDEKCNLVACGLVLIAFTCGVVSLRLLAHDLGVAFLSTLFSHVLLISLGVACADPSWFFTRPLPVFSELGVRWLGIVINGLAALVFLFICANTFIGAEEIHLSWLAAVIVAGLGAFLVWTSLFFLILIIKVVWDMGVFLFRAARKIFSAKKHSCQEK